MKLAFVLFKYFPYGGLERDFLRIAKECQARGHDIYVYSFIWQGELPKGFNLTLIPVKGFTNHQRIHHFSQQFSQLLISHAQPSPFDLIIGFNKMKDLDLYYAADPCYEAKVRQQHGKLYRLGYRYKIFRAMEEAVFAATHNVELLFISDIQMANFKRIYHTPNKQFHSLPPGVDRSRIRPDNALEIRLTVRQHFSLNDTDKLLLMIGTGYHRKGVDRTMKALASLPDAQRQQTFLLIAGEDKLKKYRTLAKHLGIDTQVHLLGARNDIPQLLLASDLFIHPARHENTGTVLLEAIAAGIPQLISGVCGYAFHIEQAQAGIVLTEPFQQSELNQQLLFMLTSDQWQQWQHNALHYMRHSDIFSMPDKVADIIEATAKHRPIANIYQHLSL
jgi:UDP-glucose:(heptosyl)LPS alpha-1,3-glucosyltransferase